MIEFKLDGMEAIPKIYAAVPGELEPHEIDDFVAFVLTGGEVDPNDLRDRVTRAHYIAFLREKGCLLGVGGLKQPSENHRNEVSVGSKTKIIAQDFPFELGWVFILPSARGRKLSFPLCQPLVTAAKGRGIFATSRVDNGSMYATLGKLGFIRTGVEWPSKQNNGNLALFVKHGGTN